MKEFISKLEQDGFNYPKANKVPYEHSEFETFREGEGIPVYSELLSPIFEGPNKEELDYSKEFISNIEQDGFNYPEPKAAPYEHTQFETFREGEGIPVYSELLSPIFEGHNKDKPNDSNFNEDASINEESVEMVGNVVTDAKLEVISTSASADLKGVKLVNNARLSVKAPKANTYINRLSIDGDFPREQGEGKGKVNTIVSTNDTNKVYVTNAKINPTSAYNCLEIGLSEGVLPKEVNITDCEFSGKFSNNAISIFGTQDNAVINIKNCHFEYVSNALRISNRTNAKNVVINVENCTVDRWEDSSLEYAGFSICQDYTSGSEEKEMENNLFGDGKVTINFKNVIGPNGVKLDNELPIMNNATYVYFNTKGLINYVDNPNYYPTVNFLG